MRQNSPIFSKKITKGVKEGMNVPVQISILEATGKGTKMNGRGSSKCERKKAGGEKVGSNSPGLGQTQAARLFSFFL